MVFSSLFTGLVRDREIFVRDGDTVRRINVPVFSQIAMACLLLCLTAWSGYAAARLATAETAVVSYQLHETEQHAQIEQKQRALAALAKTLLDERYEARLNELKDLGVKVEVAEGVGGPFESADGGDETFRQLFASWKKLDHLQAGTIAVPSDKPVKAAGLTSGFGTRNDPFKGRRAMHAGIDLAGPVGTPIYSTADGTVLRAGYNSGGYGNLVEVDHGNGIVTRYAHMSKVHVARGQKVARGQQVGAMGSTGRSTGSHLHYEVRIDDKPVNPIPFMKSVDYVMAMEQSTTMHDMALGGGGK